MSQNAIELRGLKKTYAATKKTEAKTALSGIDLDIPRGSIFGLLGPNGAGKSTLINILAGLVKKSAGSVNIWGFDQDENPRQSRAAIGVMPQELNLDVHNKMGHICMHGSSVELGKICDFWNTCDQMNNLRHRSFKSDQVQLMTRGVNFLLRVGV